MVADERVGGRVACPGWAVPGLGYASAGWLANDGDLRCTLAGGFGTFCCEQG